jgi:hypothetical protein
MCFRERYVSFWQSCSELLQAQAALSLTVPHATQVPDAHVGEVAVAEE